ncbi:MAG: hypothetical protein Q3988_05605 [Gemella sp.]|nr:hypothetical protein [Gemella sp.]
MKKQFEIARNVYKTTNYSIFKVGKKSESYWETYENFIETAKKTKQLPLVVVSEDFEIISGFIAFEVCEALGLPVQFVIDKEEI